MKPETKSFLARFLMIVMGCAFFVFLAKDFSFDSILPTIFFIFCVGSADFINVVLPQESTVSVSLAFILAAILLFPPSEAIIIAGMGTLLAALVKQEVKGKKSNVDNLVFPFIKRSIVVGSSALVFNLLGGRVGDVRLFSGNILPLTGVSASYIILDITLDQLLISLRRYTSIIPVWFGTVKFLSPIYLALATTGILMALMYRGMAFWGILLFFLPLLVTQHSFKLYINIKKTYQSTVRALATAIETQDPKKRGHAKRVADYAINIARELGIHGDQLELIGYAALLHDIGKLGIEEDLQDEFLAERWQELPEELRLAYEEEKQLSSKETNLIHAAIGAAIVKQIDYLKDISDIVRRHHTPYAGGDLERGEKIPLAAKIINLATCYDELTQMEPEDECLSPRQAFFRLKKEQGFRFDPKVVRALRNVLHKQGKLLAI